MLSEEEGEQGLGPTLDLIGSGVLERAHQFRRLVWSGIRFARGRTLALGAGLMVAAVAFSLLTASVEVGTAHIQGVVSRNWRGAYDLLVLPRQSGSSATAPHQLVEANYLSADDDGITMAQYRHVAGLPGVGVAAPLEVVGYVLETVSIPVDLSSEASGRGPVVLELTSRFESEAGLSRYPAQPAGYVYVTPDELGPVEIERGLIGRPERLPGGGTVLVCPMSLSTGSAQPSPFAPPPGALEGSCYSRRDPGGQIEGYVTWSLPVLVAGIDPAAEETLDHLAGAVTSGDYLGARRAPTTGPAAPGKGGGRALTVPVLASTVGFDGEIDHLSVARLPPAAVGVARSGDPARIASAFAAAGGVTVARLTITGAQAWAALLAQLRAESNELPGGGPVTTELAQILGQYWTAGPVSYRRGPGGVKTAVAVSNPPTVWESGLRLLGRSYVFAPPSAAGVGFRRLDEHLSADPQGVSVQLHEVGTFDPYRLTGFAGRSPLASYSAPLLRPVGAASRRLLRGSALEPDGNPAGLAQEPPLLLTTLAGARALEDPANFSGTGAAYAAPIGSIRVRVSGLHGSVPEQLGKIAFVAHEISRATGLRVVVTAGSSTQLVVVRLPRGRFGRPALEVSEPWSEILVALVVLRQADRESVALLVLILVVCALFLSGAALAGVRSRREEIAVLRALGWSRPQVLALVLGELATLGLLAGVAGAVLSAVLVAGLGLDVPLWRALLVLPVAFALALAAGLVPALLASRIEPAGAFSPAARAPRRRGWPVRSVWSMACTDVARTPGRCALAALALGTGVVGLAVLLAAETSFAHSIGDSALAGLVTSSTRGTDLASAVLAVGLGAAAVADITYLNLRERAGELAALAACGWGRPQLGRLLLTESLVTAVAGSLLGAVGALLLAGYAFGLSWPVVLGVLAAAAAGVAAGLLGTSGVLVVTGGRSLTAALAVDE